MERLFSFIDLPDVLTINKKGNTLCQNQIIKKRLRI